MANSLITQLNNPAVLQRLNRQGAIVVSILLIVACAYLLAQLTWLFIPQDESLPQLSTGSETARPTGGQANSQARVRQLAASNLFGKPQAKVQQTATTAPETKLNLVLRGVLAATPMEMASAIIAQGKSGKEDIYSVGDRIAGGVELKEVHADHVLLSRNGNLEVLKLPKDNAADNMLSRNQAGRGGSGGSMRSMSSHGSPGAALKQIRSEIMQNPTSFADYAVPVVVKENGKQIGYRLQPQSKGELLSELGIQSSDVITQINGVKLDKQQNGISALRSLTSATNINIVVKRNGAEIPLNISLQ